MNKKIELVAEVKEVTSTKMTHQRDPKTGDVSVKTWVQNDATIEFLSPQIVMATMRPWLHAASREGEHIMLKISTDEADVKFVVGEKIKISLEPL